MTRRRCPRKTVPAVTSRRARSLPGRSRISAARTARPAQPGRGAGWARRSTAASGRSTSSPAFLDADERSGRASQPPSRVKIRQSRRRDTADHHVLRLTSTHRRRSQARQTSGTPPDDQTLLTPARTPQALTAIHRVRQGLADILGRWSRAVPGGARGRRCPRRSCHARAGGSRPGAADRRRRERPGGPRQLWGERHGAGRILGGLAKPGTWRSPVARGRLGRPGAGLSGGRLVPLDVLLIGRDAHRERVRPADQPEPG
jgi:hypothetical protein